MSCRAVLICPGRGSYNRSELGYLSRHHASNPLLAQFDALRRAEGEVPLSELDRSAQFSDTVHGVDSAAAPLIYSASCLDALALAQDIDLIAITGNAMGWYSALAIGGALSPEGGFQLVNTLGRLMQEAAIGGQLLYPCCGPDWRPDAARRAALLETFAMIDGDDAVLRLSIDLGGMLVLAGDEAGLMRFKAAVPPLDQRFPLRLPQNGAYHTHLQAPVAKAARKTLPQTLFSQPDLPLIDGRGTIWWPGASDLAALHAYTLGTQICESYDFRHAILVAAREFAPDMFIIAGPGSGFGSTVAQALIACNWKGLDSRASFQEHQEEAPLLISMGDEDQRDIVTE